VLVLRDFALRAEDGRMTMVLNPGQFLCILGPAAAGKSRLAAIIAGQASGMVFGQVSGPDRVSFAEAGGLSGRTRISPGRGGALSVEATELLGRLGLWDVRTRPVSELSSGQTAAAEIYFAVTAGAPMVVLDGQLDHLDVVTREFVEGYLEAKRADGLLVAVVTHDVDLAERADAIVVMQDRFIRYAGPPEGLARTAGPTEITVETTDQKAARALVEPFSISAQATDSGWKLTADEGQAVAARLLRDGYGDVKWVMMRTPRLRDALRNLLSV
jgi:ABC-type multidrug transport system ATPase subunit